MFLQTLLYDACSCHAIQQFYVRVLVTQTVVVLANRARAEMEEEIENAQIDEPITVHVRKGETDR